MTLIIDADDALVAAARARAEAEHTTLDVIVGRMLEEYVERQQAAERAMSTIRRLQKVVDTSGQKFTREEMNERRLP